MFICISHCRDPSTTLVGFGWDSSDEAKMRASFGIGRACFGPFLDLQRIAASLGYCDYGLSALAARVLALSLPKPRSVRALPLQDTLNCIRIPSAGSLCGGHI